jgi:N-dimethylarginine dimethylaminohydrolase
MGKDERHAEPEAIKTYFQSINVPILGKIQEPGTLEGGDVVWIDERTVAVGEGYRSNAEGIHQFKALLGDLVDEVISVPLPHWTGPGDCLHLMSNVSPIDHDLYLVYSRLLSVPFRQYLIKRGIKLLEVPDEEYESMGCNVLSVAPKKCIMIEGNPMTQQRLEAEGVEVHTYDGSEISLKGAGGPTCLTRPFLRFAS